jgi:hypothetical protein
MGKNYHVVPSDEGWKVKREGAERAGSVHDTQREAIDAGRPRAIRDLCLLKTPSASRSLML